MNKIKSFESFNINEYVDTSNKHLVNGKSININSNNKINVLCSIMYECLSLLVNGEYAKVYSTLYNIQDKLYDYFKDDESVSSFMMKVHDGVDHNNMFEIYEPIEEIVLNLMDKIL